MIFFSTSLFNSFFFSCLRVSILFIFFSYVLEKNCIFSHQFVSSQLVLVFPAGTYLFQLHFLPSFSLRSLNHILINTLLLRFTRGHYIGRFFKLMSFIIMSQKVSELKNYSLCGYSALVNVSLLCVECSSEFCGSVIMAVFPGDKSYIKKK